MHKVQTSTVLYCLLLPPLPSLPSLSSAFSCLARFTSSALTPAASAAASVFFSSADFESSISCCALAMRLSTVCQLIAS